MFLFLRNLHFLCIFFLRIDTDQLVNCNMRTVGPKRIFIGIGIVCICLVVALFLILDNDRSENARIIPNRHERSLKGNIERSVINPVPEKYFKDNVRKKSYFLEKTLQSETLERIKRQVADPNDYYVSEPNVRQKRLSEHLQHVKSQFERCRNSIGDKNECEKFYREMVAVSEALNHEIKTMSEIAQNFDQSNQRNQRIFENHGKIPKFPETVGNPFYELDGEGQVLQSVNEYTSYPRFHEDLDSRRFHPWKSDEASKVSEFPKPPLSPTRNKPPVASARDNDKLTPLKNPSFGKNLWKINSILCCLTNFIMF